MQKIFAQGGNMKKQIIISNLLIILLSAVAFGYAKKVEKQDGPKPVKTVEFVDLEKYAGKWFEIARYPNKFQKKCVSNTTATYNIKENKEIEVINECLKKDGKIDKAKGKGKVVDKDSNAKLEVRFAPAFLSFLPQVWGDYWILDLDENYDYAVVGDPDREYLWILSRKTTIDTATYEKILENLDNMGFNPNKLIKTPQDTEVIKGEVITKPQT